MPKSKCQALPLGFTRSIEGEGRPEPFSVKKRVLYPETGVSLMSV